MHPILFQLGPVTIHTYGTLLAIGILLALWLAQRRAPAAGLDSDRVWNLGVYMVLAALAGAKAWLVFADWPYYRQNPGDILSWSTLQAGGVWYGGLLTAAVVLVLYARHAKLPYARLGDVYAAPLALGHGIGRLGCFSAGCCYGKPTTMPWGVVFSSPYAHQLLARRWASICIPRNCTKPSPNSSTCSSSCVWAWASARPVRLSERTPSSTA